MARNFDGMYIGGRWVHPGRSFDDLNPADGSVWARVPDGGLAEARAAIDAAQAAFPDWAGLMFQQRSHFMI
jgi:acyl-CoA reductase-like NAD-dependent aldehyde dehydrogenase